MVMTQEFRNHTDATRLLMLLGVVLIHCNILSVIPGGADAVVTQTVDFFSLQLTTVSVPWFFMISAYLTGCKGSGMRYGEFLRKRVRGILVPYLIWNTIAVVVRICLQLTPLNQYTSGGYDFSSLPQALVEIYWGPTLWPLWFLRNLFIYSLLLPVLRRMLDGSIMLTMTLLLVMNDFTMCGGIFYYGVGLVLARRCGPDVVTPLLRRLVFLAPLFVAVLIVGDLTGFNLLDIPLARNIPVLAGVIGFWGLCSRPLAHRYVAGRADAIFFVYAFHGLISPYVVKGLARWGGWDGAGWLGCYFGAFVIIVLMSYGVYYLVSKCCPAAMRYLTGGRVTGV